MNVWLDLGVAAIIALFCFSGWKRGVVHMALNAAGTVASMVAASLIASPLALPVYNWLIRDNIVNGLTQATSGIKSSDSVQAAEQILNSVSSFTQNAFAFMNIDANSLSKKLNESVLNVPSTIEEMIRPTAVQTVVVVLTVLLFTVFMIIVSIVSKKLSKTINKTILRVPNRVLGILVGLVEAVLISMLLLLIVYFVMMFISPDACRSLKESIDNTIFIKFIRKISLPELIISWLSAI